MSTAQQAQILSSAGLLQTTQMLNSSLVEEAILNSNISGSKAEQILTELGVIEAKTGNLIVTKECTASEVAQALATKGIVGADAEAILSQLGLASANATTTASFAGLTSSIKAATVAMAKWLFTNPVGWCVLAGGAIFGLVKAYDALHISEEEMAEAHEESVQKAKDSISEYEDLKQELETIQQTYEDNEQQLEDLYRLRKNQTITQAEEDYLTTLEGQNEKLKQQLEYKQALADIEAKEAEKDAVSSLQEESQNGDFIGYDGSIPVYDKITDAEKIKRNTGTIKHLTSELLTFEKAIQGVALSQEELDQITANLNEMNAFGEDNLSTDELKIKKMYEAILNGTLTYEEYEQAVSYSKEAIQDLVSENDELLQNVEPLNNAIVSTTGENYELKKANDEIIASAKDAAVGFNEYTNSLNGTANALKEISKKPTVSNIQHLSNIQSMESDLDKIGEIYKDVQDMDTFDYSYILNNEEFATIFSEYTEEYQKFIETISDSPDDIDKCQSSFDDLVSAYINGKGFIEDVTDETKDSTIAMLEQMGVTNANEIVTRALAISKERLRLETGECVGKTYEEILAMSNLATEGSITQMVLAQLALEKKLINGTTIDTSSDIEQIYNLAQTAGASTEVLTKLAWAKKVFESTGNGSYGNFYEYQQAREFMDSIEDGSYKIKFNIDDYKVDYKAPDTSKGSGKEEEKATEILDKYFDYYEKQLQAGQITYKEYVQKCNDIRDKYYNDGKITSAEYYQYLADLYEKELEYHDKAISAVTDAIDDKIDTLEKQKEELEDYYNGLIENIQSEIDELQKANEERERAIALQKAQYELNRALNQRTDYVYQDGQFIYKAKDDAVRDAQNELDDKLFDMQISELEKQIEDLEKALEDATETIDEQINALTEYKDKWSDISSAYEESQNRIYAASILGANWEADVLDGRLDKLENFKNEYLRIQGELAKASVLGADPGATGGGSGGSSGSGGSGNGKDDKGKGEESTPKHYNTRYKVVVGGAPVYDSGNQYTAKVWMKQNAPSGTIVSYKVPVYAKGGIVGDNKSPLDSIAHSLNEDHMVAVKTGERILTPIQNSNFEKLINVSADFVKLMKPFESIMKTPDFTKFVKNGNTKNDVVMNVSINCPNVTNESGFNYITKELTSLTTKALQFDWNA